MTHCTPDQLMDVVDGVRSIASLPHLATCAACRAQLDDVRGAIGEVAAVDVPEPPPHYWRQLSTHVHDAVQREQLRRGGRPWFGVGVSWPTLWPLAAAAAVLVLAALVWPRGGLQTTPPADSIRVPAPVTPTVASSSSGLSEPQRAEGATQPDEVGVGDSAHESLIAFMQDLAEGMDAEAASASLRPDVTVTDAAVEELSNEERIEMRRLIHEALTAAGA